MEKIHRLLQRQLKKYSPVSTSIPPEWEALLETINQAYDQNDEDRIMLERSLELSSQELLQANQKLSTIISALPDCLMLCNRNGTILNYHPANLNGLQIQPHDIKNRSLNQTNLKSIVPHLQSLMDKAGETQTLISDEILLNDQGRSFQIEVRVVSLSQDQFIILLRNISDRKAAEAAVKQSEIRYRTLFESANEAIFILQDHRIIDCNPAAERLFQMDKTELIIHPLYDYAPINQQNGRRSDEYFRSQVMDVYTRQSLSFEWIAMKFNGDLFITDTTLTRFQLENQIMIQAAIHDITARKMSEITLLEEKEKMQVTLGSITEGVITVDHQGRIIYMNPAAEKMTGFTFHQAERKRLNEIFLYMDLTTHNFNHDLFKEVLEKKRPVVLPPSGELISRELSRTKILGCAAPISDEHGNARGAVVVFRDVTESRRLEEELINARKLESLGVLAGGIAHDFNNILTGLLGNISLAKSYSQPDSKVYQKLENCEKASMRARELTQQFLTFSKGGAPVRQTSTISELIIESITFILRGSKAKAEFSISNDLWPVDIDKGQISQVLNNLIINADQSMPNGGIITITGKNTPLDEKNHYRLPPGNYISLSIQDQGVGIEPENLSKVFDPYYTTKKMGSGLGLTSCYSIIKKHNGHIVVESEPLHGTLFTILLPASQHQILSAPDSNSIISGSGRILLMDDEESIRVTTSEQLLYLGYEVMTASNGDDAIRLYHQALTSGNPFDLVILDLTIPGSIGGKEVLQNLKRHYPMVNAIVSSGYSNDPVLADYLTYGFCGIITKPYRIEELSQAVLAALKTGPQNTLHPD
ncbi:MAG: PAS domain S-box protein [Candidatus Delongbacteria bacterium]|nr:PAS domain S-box protein [Candidatus Delongbacteria bacterium]